ncbi:MAG: S8/S53 family peptidase [Acidobacteriota bacterium]|nr:S8/S53 family peptidase [Acidobacteriota bacterium]
MMSKACSSPRLGLRCPALPWVAVLMVLSAVWAGALGAAEVNWLRTAPDCTAPAPNDGTLLQLCGSVGRYYLATTAGPPAVECAAEVSAHDHAAFYARSETGPAGSCFQRNGGPWVAVADVAGHRSKGIGCTLLESADGTLGTGLLDLAAAHARMPDRLGLPSDAHLLAVLCDLVQAVEDGVEEPPLAVVIPFGRHVDGPPDCSGDEANLPCQVDRALAHLQDAHGVIAVAAAGDHRATTFPAAAEHALAVGSLDGGSYVAAGAVGPSWESPPGTPALVPGVGVVVDFGRSEGPRPLPAGSATAAGLFAGWLGGTLVQGSWQPPDPFPYDGLWLPWPQGENGGEGFVLSLDGAELPGSSFAGADRLMAAALGLAASGASGPLPVPEVYLQLTAETLTLPDLSLPGLVASLHDEWPPLPEVLPCVPCSGSRPDPPPASPQNPDETGGDELVVDLSLSSPSNSFYDLWEIGIRLGEDLYRLDGGADPVLLDQIAAGTVEAVGLQGIDPAVLLATGDSASLIFILAYGDTPFWHSVPLVLPAAGEGQ